MDRSFPVFEKYSYIPVIAGPTASGKSALALEICRLADGELVCADSMQIYRGLDVGTAKDSKEEIGDIPELISPFAIMLMQLFLSSGISLNEAGFP